MAAQIEISIVAMIEILIVGGRYPTSYSPPCCLAQNAYECLSSRAYLPP